MAYALIATPGPHHPLRRIGEALTAIRVELRARRVYARTLRELRALSARERADLGISQTMMTRLAAEAAWGRT